MLKAGIIGILAALMFIGCHSRIRPGDESPAQTDMSEYQPGPAQNAGKAYPLDKLPVQVYEEVPRYPSLAVMNNIEGYVVILAYVDKNGKVTKAKSKKCSHAGLGFEEAAIAAAYQCRYKSAEKNGKPTGCWVEYQVNFVLH